MKEAHVVSLGSSNYGRVYQDLSHLIELAGGLKLRDRDTVVTKINLCDFRTPETGAITHPSFLEALLRYLRENYKGLKIYVVESDATLARPDLFVKWLGFLPVIKRWDAFWCNLSKQKTIEKVIKGRHFRRIEVPLIFEGSYFITVPKMKTSVVTRISCALKNQFGCLPITKKIKFHPYIDDVIVDVNLAMPPDFCIVDGIIAIGGTQGPTYGVPIPAGLILAGRDPVAVDTVVAKIMGFNPNSIGHVRKAQESGVGSMNYHIVGRKIEETQPDFLWDPMQSLIMSIGARLRARVRAPDG